LTDDVRRAAIRERDETARIVSRKDDPGSGGRCPQSCPFYDYCMGGGNVPGSKQ